MFNISINETFLTWFISTGSTFNNFCCREDKPTTYQGFSSLYNELEAKAK